MDDTHLSLTGKHWRLHGNTSTVDELFAARGIDAESAPSLVAPNVFPDMPRAVKRIHDALEGGERIGIFGDYDCDGVTAVAQLVRFFRRRNCEPWVRLPHRVHDGYGLSASICDESIGADVSLLITADTGITATDEIALLQKRGIDVIVTDHHTPREQLPLAYAIIHPALCKHPVPHPSGAGVVYKLIHALEGKPWNDVASDTALAMLGTVADLVELRGDNRALTRLGLQAFNSVADGPIYELREHCHSGGSLSSVDIAFKVAPRINAAGRMASPDIALNALLEGGRHLAHLDRLNEQRQSLTRELCDRVFEEIDNEDLPPVLVSASKDYPHGIVGLIAGKLTERYGRPSLVAHVEDDVCTASLRSTDAYNITLGLGTCTDLLRGYGGHAQAAGCTFSLRHLQDIASRLSADVLLHVTATELVPTLDIDMELTTNDLTPQLFDALQSLQPYGQGNPEPLFVFRNVSLGDTRICGKENTHLTGRIGDTKCVGFTLGAFAGKSDTLDVVARVELSAWNGKTEPQIVIVDVAKPLYRNQCSFH